MSKQTVKAKFAIGSRVKVISGTRKDMVGCVTKVYTLLTSVSYQIKLDIDNDTYFKDEDSLIKAEC